MCEGERAFLQCTCSSSASGGNEQQEVLVSRADSLVYSTRREVRLQSRLAEMLGVSINADCNYGRPATSLLQLREALKIL